MLTKASGVIVKHDATAEGATPLLCCSEPQWLGIGPEWAGRWGGHIVRRDPVLPFEMCDLQHGTDQGMGRVGGPLFWHSWVQWKHFMHYVFLSCFQFNSPSSSVLSVCPCPFCPSQSLALRVYRVLQPREQNRDQAALAILQPPVPCVERGPESLRLSISKRENSHGACDLLYLGFWRAKG